MKLKEILEEGYKKDHKCKTPGAIYKTKVHSDRVSIKVDLPDDINQISSEESEDLEAELHYAIEKVLAKYYF